MIDATGLLVLPGVVDVHTHTRVATDAEPDRFFQDSVAAAFGGTTTFLSFNNPGTGSSPAAERSLLTASASGGRRPTATPRSTIGLSLAVSGHCDDPLAELPATIEAGVATSKAFMVFDFRLPDARLFEAMGVMGRHGGMLQVHCEDPVLLDAAVSAALQRGDVLPRYHATTRPSYVEAVATARALAFARMADAPVHVVHLSSAAALEEVRRAKAVGVRVTAETCPHYLVLTEERYDDPDPASCARYVISPPLRTPADRDALWAGLADGSLDLVATDHVADRLAVEKAEAGTGASVRPDQQRRPRDRDPADDRLQRGRRQGPSEPRADGRPAGDDAGPPVRSRSQGRARGRARRRHRRCSTPPRTARCAPPTSTTRATTRHTRGSRSRAPSAASSSAGVRSSATARSSAVAAPGPSSNAARSAPDSLSPEETRCRPTPARRSTDTPANG